LSASVAIFKYRAFLSYSHRDKKWANWIHRTLENYKIDKELVGRETLIGPIPKTLRPIFRDREDFTAGHSLTEQTLMALEASQFLIVICSPNSAKSHYVNEEIRCFKALGRAKHVIPIIVDGEPGDTQRDCFPPALRFTVANDGKLTTDLEEPLAADARTNADGKDVAGQKIISALLGLSLDEIVRRAEVARKRHNRFRNGLAGLFLLLALAAAMSAAYAYQKLLESEDRLDQAIELAYSFVTEASALSGRFGISNEASLNLLVRAETALNALLEKGADSPKLHYRKAQMLISFADRYRDAGEDETSLQRAKAAGLLLEDLASRAPQNNDLRFESARSHERIGIILQRQTNLAQALESYSKFQSIMDTLVTLDPDNRMWLRARALAFQKTASILEDQGQIDKSLETYRRFLEAIQHAAAKDRSGVFAQSEVAHAQQKIAALLLRLGQKEAALESYQGALDVLLHLTSIDPDNRLWAQDLAGLYEAMARAKKGLGRSRETVETYRLAQAIWERAHLSTRGNHYAQRRLRDSLENVGDELVLQSNYGDAVTSYQAARVLLSTSIRTKPLDADRIALAKLDSRIGEALRLQGKNEEALKTYRAGLRLYADMAAAYPRSVTIRTAMLTSHSRLEPILQKLGSFDEQLENLHSAREIQTRLAELESSNATWKAGLAVSYRKIGDALLGRTRNSEALAAFGAGLAALDEVLLSDSKNTDRLVEKSTLTRKAGKLASQLGDIDQAVEVYRRGVNAAEALVSARPNSATWNTDLLTFYTEFGDLLLRKGELSEALKAFQNGLPIVQRYANAERASASWQIQLAELLEKIGGVLVAQDNLADALPSYRSSLTVRQRIADSAPDNTRAQRSLSVIDSKIGNLLMRQHKPTEALVHYRADLAVAEKLAALDPSNDRWQRDLAISHQQIVNALRMIGSDKLSAEQLRWLRDSEAKLAESARQ
jgi:eukaryotic-like serine/threonine-protein kinase